MVVVVAVEEGPVVVVVLGSTFASSFFPPAVFSFSGGVAEDGVEARHVRRGPARVTTRVEGSGGGVMIDDDDDDVTEDPSAGRAAKTRVRRATGLAG